MLKIRLQRVGRKHDPSFRIVLTDSKNGPKSGRFIEILGHYDAKKDVRQVDGERIKELMSTGAQLSDTVHNILINEKVLEGKKKNVLPRKSPIVKEEKEEKPVEKEGTQEDETPTEPEDKPKEEEKPEKAPAEEVKEEEENKEEPTEEKQPEPEIEEK